MLRNRLPDLFDFARAAGEWDSDWIIVPIDDVENEDLDEVERGEVELPFPRTVAPTEAMDDLPSAGGFYWPNGIALPNVYAGDVGQLGAVPGAPFARSSFCPPPDAFAFYLPFHYFPENVWGVYLTYEGVRTIRDYLTWQSQGCLSSVQAWYAARAFLYGHEAFHHSVESFATRLEIDRRIPLYRGGFQRLYDRQLSAGESIEEALATGSGAGRADAVAAARKWGKRERGAVRRGLDEYIQTMPPNYREGVRFVDRAPFMRGRNQLAELCRAECLGGPTVPPDLWENAPHAFRGSTNVASRVNYIVHRGSPLAIRQRLELRFFRQREVLEKLRRLAGIELERHGGNHDIYRTKNGKTLKIPRHRDLKEGTVRGIVKEAGLPMSLEQFRAA